MKAMMVKDTTSWLKYNPTEKALTTNMQPMAT